MSRWLAGGVLLLADPAYRHSRSPDYEGLAANDLWVLAAAASFAIEETAKGRRPECVASIASLARRTRLGRTAVKASLAHLEAAGRMTRAGWARREGAKSTVRWRIHGLDEATPVQVNAPEGRQATTTAREAAPSQVNGREGREATTTARATSGREATTIGSRGDHNPSDSSRPQGRGEEDRGSATRTASADAAAAAALTDDERSTPKHIRWVMDKLGKSRDAAEAWAERKVTSSSKSVTNEPAYVIACVDREIDQAEARSASSSKASAKKQPPRSAAPAAPPARRRGWDRLTGQEQAAAFEAWAAGGDVDALAAELNMVPRSLAVALGRVAQERALRSALDTGDLDGAVREWRGLTVPDGKPAVTLAGVGSRFDRARAAEVEELMLLDYPLAQLADVFGVDVAQVRAWALTRPRAAARVSPVPLAGVAAGASSATGELTVVPAMPPGWPDATEPSWGHTTTPAPWDVPRPPVLQPAAGSSLSELWQARHLPKGA